MLHFECGLSTKYRDFFLGCVTRYNELFERAGSFFKNKVDCGAVDFLFLSLEADIACGEDCATVDGNVISTVDVGYNGILGVVFLYNRYADKWFAFNVLNTTCDFQDFGITRH